MLLQLLQPLFARLLLAALPNSSAAAAVKRPVAVQNSAQKLSEVRAQQRYRLLLDLAEDRPFSQIIASLLAFAQGDDLPGWLAIGSCNALLPQAATLAGPGAGKAVPCFRVPSTLPVAWQPLLAGQAVSTSLENFRAQVHELTLPESDNPASIMLWPVGLPTGPMLGCLALGLPAQLPASGPPPGNLPEVLALLTIILERQRERQLFERRVALERVVRNISVRLLSSSDPALATPVQHALQQLGEFVGADRCYLMEHSPDGETIDNTHEWCANGIAPQIHELQNLPTVQLQNWLDLLQAQNLLIIRRREDMPPNPHWARIFEDGGIQSVLFVPMLHNNTLIGLLGFDAVRAPHDWEGGTVTLVQLVADLLVHAILRHKLIEALRYDADHDPLTGLANRRNIEQSLALEADRVQRYGGTFSVIMFDIDHFKRVNDNYGHDVGDEVLRVLAGLVANHRRRSDPVARWGGEEFLLMLPQTDVATAAQVAEHLRRLVAAASFPVPDGPITISLGVAELTAGATWNDTIVAADGALYEAKQAGRNQVKVATLPGAGGLGTLGQRCCRNADSGPGLAR